MKPVLLSLVLLVIGGAAWADEVKFELQPDNARQWKFLHGKWDFADGVLTQSVPEELTTAIATETAFSDFKLTTEFQISATGKGVRAAAVVFRATGTRTFYWLHLDSAHGTAILTRSSVSNSWIEISRKPATITQGVWHTLQVDCRGPEIRVSLDDKIILQAQDDALTAGRIGLGTSEGAVSFRNVKVEGSRVADTEPFKNEQLPYQVISRGDLSGSYHAFPDACRLPNGDILVVFYAGYSHISPPNADWPRGGRICSVTSTDEGRTWSAPSILFDGPIDDRDPHIAVLRDGTLLCTFFTFKMTNGKQEFDTCIVASRDGGQTWDKEARMLAANWAVSAPVRELADGTLILGIYTEAAKSAYGGVLRSTDKGATWSQPIPIDPQSGIRLDAETDVIQLKDGSIFAALRGDGKIHMHYSISKDLGLTWSPVKDIGFLGHSPHLNRLSTGEILLTHRLPDTSLHVSRDDGQTWLGPDLIDAVIGAYPSTVELKDHSILVVYYEEGRSSRIRALRFKLTPNGVEKLPWDPPSE